MNLRFSSLDFFFFLFLVQLKSGGLLEKEKGKNGRKPRLFDVIDARLEIECEVRLVVACFCSGVGCYFALIRYLLLENWYYFEEI